MAVHPRAPLEPELMSIMRERPELDNTELQDPANGQWRQIALHSHRLRPHLQLDQGNVSQGDLMAEDKTRHHEK